MSSIARLRERRAGPRGPSRPQARGTIRPRRRLRQADGDLAGSRARRGSPRRPRRAPRRASGRRRAGPTRAGGARRRRCGAARRPWPGRARWPRRRGRRPGRPARACAASGPAAGDRLVDGDDPEQLAVGVGQRDEQRILGVPVAPGRRRPGRSGHVGGVLEGPVHRPGGDEVRARDLVLGDQERPPVGPRRRRAHERLVGVVLLPERDDDLEVVPLRPAQVDDDGPEAGRAQQAGGDRREHGLEVAARPQGAADVQEPAELFGQGRGRRAGHHSRSSAAGPKAEARQIWSRTSQSSGK